MFFEILVYGCFKNLKPTLKICLVIELQSGPLKRKTNIRSILNQSFNKTIDLVLLNHLVLLVEHEVCDDLISPANRGLVIDQVKTQF